MRRYLGTITEDDMHGRTKVAPNHWRIRDCIGRILPQDIGKRYFDVEGVLQVENDEQMAKRLAYTLAREFNEEL